MDAAMYAIRVFDSRPLAHSIIRDGRVTA